jgi:hypothetical protein
VSRKDRTNNSNGINWAAKNAIYFTQGERGRIQRKTHESSTTRLFPEDLRHDWIQTPKDPKNAKTMNLNI